MVFSPKQWAFTHMRTYILNKRSTCWTCSTTSFVVWFMHKWLSWTGSFKWIVHIDSPTLTTHSSDIPPSLSFPSFPSLKGWKRGHGVEQTKRSLFVNHSVQAGLRRVLFTLIIVTLIIQSDEILLSGQRFRPEHLFWVFGLKRNR